MEALAEGSVVQQEAPAVRCKIHKVSNSLYIVCGVFARYVLIIMSNRVAKRILVAVRVTLGFSQAARVFRSLKNSKTIKKAAKKPS